MGERVKHGLLQAAVEALRVQVPNNHILTQNLCYNYYYPKPKYQIIGSLDPLGRLIEVVELFRF